MSSNLGEACPAAGPALVFDDVIVPSFRRHIVAGTILENHCRDIGFQSSLVRALDLYHAPPSLLPMQVQLPFQPHRDREVHDLELHPQAHDARSLIKSAGFGRVFGICAQGLCAVVLSLAVMVLLIMARFAYGAIDLNFMGETIRNSIAIAAGPGHKVDLHNVELAWSEGNLRVAVRDLRLYRDDGLTIGLAPTAYLGLDLSALLVGRIEAVSLTAQKPAVTLTVAQDGSVTLGGEPPQERGQVITPILALLDPELISRVFGTQTLVQGGSSLAALALDGMTVTLTDQRTGMTRVFESFTAEFQRTELGAFSTK